MDCTSCFNASTRKKRLQSEKRATSAEDEQDAQNEKKNIDCDFEEKDNYVYSVDSLFKIEKELTALNKIGFSAESIV